jgi:hypothetical protein
VTGRRARPEPGARAAILVGLLAAFVGVVDLVRLLRWPLLSDPEPSWAAPRLVLAIAVAAAGASVGVLGGGAFLLFARSRLGRAEPTPVAVSRRALAAIAIAAIGAGAGLRLLVIARVPIPYLEDEVNLVGPALELSGTWSDFRDAIRPIPYGVPDPHETIGVVYLRLLRSSLAVFGTTPFGVRFPSAAAGCLSLLTGTLLARALLPAGGGTLAALVLSGLRWHVILSLSGWQSILLVPLCDVAALLLLSARRRGSAVRAGAAGLALGIGAHLYLASWVAASALTAFAALPRAAGARREGMPSRAALAAGFAAGFLAAAAPIFLFAQGRATPYFGRTSRHSVFAEMRYSRSGMPLFAAAADAIVAPFGLPEPEGRHDLTDRSRLGLVVGLAFALGFLGALVRPGNEASSLLLCHGAAAFVAAVAAGQAGLPNGFRFGYLTTVTALAASAGTLTLAGLWPGGSRAAAWLVMGALAAASLLGVREATLVWPDREATFDSFHGEDTLLGLAAARWDPYGVVSVEGKLGRNDLTVETVRRFRLDAGPEPGSSALRPRRFRIVRPGSKAAPGERLVERVRDLWGREWAVAYGRAARS